MLWYWWLLAVAVFIAALIAWWKLHGVGGQIQHERARELFRLQHEQLEAKFLDAAAATGKPRGLIWVDCAFEPKLELVRDVQSRQLMGLVPVTVKFSAVEGGPMEGVEAVDNLRYATAVFTFQSGQWVTRGRTLFNMHPDEAIEHFAGQVVRVQ